VLHSHCRQWLLFRSNVCNCTVDPVTVDVAGPWALPVIGKEVAPVTTIVELALPTMVIVPLTAVKISMVAVNPVTTGVIVIPDVPIGV